MTKIDMNSYSKRSSLFVGNKKKRFIENIVRSIKSVAALLIVSLCFDQAAVAGSCTNCTVKSVGCSYLYMGVQSCIVVFNQTIDPAGQPACAQTMHDRMAFDITKEGGKAIFALASMANALNTTVSVYGNNYCEVLSTYETINILYKN
jgi:hypothetical protein